MQLKLEKTASNINTWRYLDRTERRSGIWKRQYYHYLQQSWQPLSLCHGEALPSARCSGQLRRYLSRRPGILRNKQTFRIQEQAGRISGKYIEYRISVLTDQSLSYESNFASYVRLYTFVRNKELYQILILAIITVSLLIGSYQSDSFTMSTNFWEKILKV